LCAKAYLAAIFLTILWQPSEPLAADCGARAMDAEVAISRVVDGDTIRLQGGGLLRFIGINTPEIDYESGQSEPFSEAARDYLTQRFKADKHIFIIYGKQSEDRYGRSLAHLFFANGESVQRSLLLAGLAAWIVVPPNTTFKDCYGLAEKQARRARRGLWGGTFYEPLLASSVKNDLRGFHFIAGKVIRISRSKKSYWLNMSKGFALRIRRTDLLNFTSLDPLQLKGRRLVARGWVYSYKDQLVMGIRHEAALEID
jgi:endonuclease YncB( thermonuclease family)